VMTRRAAAARCGSTDMGCRGAHTSQRTDRSTGPTSITVATAKSIRRGPGEGGKRRGRSQSRRPGNKTRRPVNCPVVGHNKAPGEAQNAREHTQPPPPPPPRYEWGGGREDKEQAGATCMGADEVLRRRGPNEVRKRSFYHA
jgi:hypothetical protein